MPLAPRAYLPRTRRPSQRRASHAPYRTHRCGELRKLDVGQRGAPERLGTPKARPRPATLHRPARPCRAGAAGLPARDGRLQRARRRLRLESVVTVDGRGGRPNAPRPSTRACRPARSRSWRPSPTSNRQRTRCPCRSTPSATTRRRCGSRYRFLDLRRERMQRNIVLRSQVIQSIRRRMLAAGLHRAADADPDRQLARGGARLPGAVAAASRAGSTPCRRRRSNTSSST